jgi:hypothetical protein
MNTNTNVTKVKRVFSPDTTDNKQRGYTYLWAIYPSYWKKEWGEAPLLGRVRADSEFDAIRAAYDKKLLTVNFTFEPLPVKIQPLKRKESK